MARISPPASRTSRLSLPSSSGKMRRPAIFSARRRASAWVSPAATPINTVRPGPMRPTSRSSSPSTTLTAERTTRSTTALISRAVKSRRTSAALPIARLTACSAWSATVPGASWRLAAASAAPCAAALVPSSAFRTPMSLAPRAMPATVLVIAVARARASSALARAATAVLPTTAGAPLAPALRSTIIACKRLCSPRPRQRLLRYQALITRAPRASIRRIFLPPYPRHRQHRRHSTAHLPHYRATTVPPEAGRQLSDELYLSTLRARPRGRPHCSGLALRHLGCRDRRPRGEPADADGTLGRDPLADRAESQSAGFGRPSVRRCCHHGERCVGRWRNAQ